MYGWHLLSGTDHCAGHIHIQVWLGRTNTMVDERPVTEMVIKDESECLSGRLGGWGICEMGDLYQYKR